MVSGKGDDDPGDQQSKWWVMNVEAKNHQFVIYKDIEIYIKRYIKQIEIPITLSSSTVIIRGIHIMHVNYWVHRLRPRCFQARPSSLIRMALNIRKVIHTTYDLNQMTHVYDSVCERLGLSRCARGNSNSPPPPLKGGGERTHC